MFCTMTRVVRHTGLLGKDIKILPVASMSTGNNNVSPEIYNRNPRNLERLRIAYKPSGYHLEAPGREFWHKLTIDKTSRHITAKIVHNTGCEVITASTNEWAINKFLYRANDTSAYINLARVFAQRCLQSGITEVFCNIKPNPGGKVDVFLKTLEENGMTLSEPKRFLPHRPWDVDRPEKPWNITE